MIVKELKQLLPKEITTFFVEMKDYSTIGIGGKVLALIKPRNIKELILSVKRCRKSGIKYQVVGNLSNVLLKSNYTRVIIITTRNMERQYFLNKTELVVSSGTYISELIEWCIDKGLSGLEELYGIPATIGGMVMMNAGAFNKQIFDNIVEIEILSKGKVKTIKKEDVVVGHHTTSLLKTDNIILSVKFKLERLAPSVIKSKCKEVVLRRLEKQPKEKSLGSIFLPTIDGVPAGLIIDKLGLKGLTIGGAKISEKHANFIINTLNATDADVKKIIKIINTNVKNQYNFTLQREIEYLGDRYESYRWLSYTLKI